MRILFDQGTPSPLRHHLVGHEVSTASEMGWSSLTNGELLRAAEGRFELIITTDQRMRFEQNLAGKSLAVLILTTTQWSRVEKHVALVMKATSQMKPGTFNVLEIPYF